jgi:hypothetical protein
VERNAIILDVLADGGKVGLAQILTRQYDMNGRFQMQRGKNWILPTEMNANRFF